MMVSEGTELLGRNVLHEVRCRTSLGAQSDNRA
jgi:hypothetical protein